MKDHRTFGVPFLEFLKSKQIGRHTVIRVTGIDKSLLSRFVNNHRTPSPWKAFLMGWNLGTHFERLRSLTTPEGRLLCTA